MAAAAIMHDTWQIAAVQLGGTKVAAAVRPHHRNQGRVLDAVAAELDRVSQRFGARVRAAAVAIGRGVAGLVNGLDPHLVVVGGFGPELLHIADDEVTAAYHDGLMAFRAIQPPPIVPARLGSDAPLLGAADEAFALLLTDEGLQAWAARQL